MKIFDVDKFTDFLYDIMEENEKHIENDNDGDNQCKFENETIDNIMSFMMDEKFYKLEK
jgi:hypothetical protein